MGKDPQIQLVGPPVIVLLADTHGSVVDRALAFQFIVGSPISGVLRCGKWYCGWQSGASTPVDDFGFVDDEALIVAAVRQGVADGAIDIGEVAAGAADHVVMVVTGMFVSGEIGGLSGGEVSLGEDREGVIDD